MAKKPVKAVPMNLEAFDPSSPPREGDVFAYRLKGHPFMYGRVIRVGIHQESFPAVLVYIYKTQSNDIATPTELSKNNLLLPPMLIDPACWAKGYIRTIDNKPITENDKFKQHCFRDVLFDKYVDEYGKEISKRLEPCGIYGVAPYTGFDNKISRALGIPEAR